MSTHRADKEHTILARRELLVGAGAAASLAASGTAWSAGHAHANPTKGGAALLDALASCQSEGERCLTHCLASFSGGDTALAECAAKVREMLSVCSATATLVAANSTHKRAMAGVCLAACQDCRAACQAHADMHETCRSCMDACDRVLPLLEALGA